MLLYVTIADYIAIHSYRERESPTRYAHRKDANETTHRPALASSHLAGAFRIHQLHRSLQSFHRCSHAERRAASFRVSVRCVALFIFLELRISATLFRVVGGSPQRKLG